MTPHQARDDDLTTIALGVLSLVTIGIMARLFRGQSFLAPVLATAAAAHLTCWATRRCRLSALPGLAITVAVTLLIAAWTVLPHTTAYGIPWRGTLNAALDALGKARDQFGQVVAPVNPTTGFVLAAALGAAIVAILADWAAFRVGSTWESVVPAFGLFIFTAILGDARGRWAAVGLEIAAILAFLAVHGARSRARGLTWFVSRGEGARTALLSGAALLGIISVASALLIGPRLPGAYAQGLIAFRGGDEEGAGRRTTISPLVDIRGRLTERSNLEAFTVRADDRAYWRLTALDTFDGSIWSSNDSYRRVGGSLPRAGPRPPATAVTQTFAIRDLSSIWLPAAYRPARVSGVSGVSYNAESGSLISREATSDGLTYSVVSERPSLTRADLAEAPELSPLSLRQHLDLPVTVTGRVLTFALRATAGATTPYDRALSLQQLLRGNYRYELGVDQGHDETALEKFLFETKAGYCEQFAGAYAVLARAVGLPSRVAVGFTPGELEGDGLFHVRGLHAHAWPEVYLLGYGWVAFEPTPGRGIPGAEPYTLVPEQQASGTDPSTATTAPPTTAAVGPGASPNAPSTTAPGEEQGPGAGNRASRILLVAAWIVASLAALAVLWATVLPATRAARRRRRRSGARTAAERVWVAWIEADETLQLVSARRRPAETLAEHARRASVSVPPLAAPALGQIARDATTASYAEDFPTEMVDGAISAAATVSSAVRAATPRARRALSLLRPR